MTATLNIDTISDDAQIQLLDKSKIIDSKKWTRDRALAVKLITAIDNLLKDHHLKLSDLKQIAVRTNATYLSSARTGYIIASIFSVTAQVSLKINPKPHS